MYAYIRIYVCLYIYIYKQYTPANSSQQLEALTQYWILILSC